MATVALTTANQVDVVESIDQENGVCAADITAGTFVRKNSTSGKWEQALATSTANAAGARMALRTAKAGEALTALRVGKVAGFTVSQAYNAALYLSDTGTLADAAGTASVQVGRVITVSGQPAGSSPDKIVELSCPV